MRNLTRPLLAWLPAVPTVRLAARALAACLCPGRGRSQPADAPASPREFPEWLRTFHRTFSERCRQTDQEFVELARGLRTLYETAQALAGMVSAQLGDLRGALDASRIAGANGLTERCLTGLTGGLAETAAELGRLRAVAKGLQQLRRQVESLEQVGLQVRTVVISFAVESARTADCQAAFGAFLTELRGLGERISQVAAAIATQASATRLAQEREWQTLSASHGELCQVAQQLETTAHATAAEAQALLDEVLAGLQQAEGSMRQITRQAEEAVYYLQFGDIVRQKTEHVAAALHDAAERLGASTVPREFRAHAAAVAPVLAIQISQLEVIRQEVAAARDSLERSFGGLAAESSQLRETLPRWGSDAAAGPAGPRPLHALKADLLRLKDLNQQGRQVRLGARRTAQLALATSQDLARHVEQVKTINADIHLLALNAIVKTAALDTAGATLSVLSMHVSALHRESGEVLAEIVALIETILHQARAGGAQTDAGGDVAPEPALPTSLERIESVYDAGAATAAATGDLVNQQQLALERSRSLLQLLTQHGAILHQQIRELTTFRELLAPWGAESRPTTEDLAALSQRYTMRSEREVHERTGRSPAAPARDSAATTGDQFAFFDAPRQPAVAPSLAPATAASEPAATAVPAVAAAGITAQLGDNVELF